MKTIPCPVPGTSLRRKLWSSLFTVALVATSLPAHANLLVNGSLEDLDQSFVNHVANYMGLGAGSTTISGWTVTPDTAGQIVWAKSPTTDGYNAAAGTFFTDLSGFGASSFNGALTQMLSGLIVGETYDVSFDFYGSAATLQVGGDAVVMGGYTADPHGNVAWQLAYGTFTATSADMLFEVRNGTPGSTIVFLDNLVVDGPTVVTVPDGGNPLLLLAAATLVLGGCRRRRTV